MHNEIARMVLAHASNLPTKVQHEPGNLHMINEAYKTLYSSSIGNAELARLLGGVIVTSAMFLHHRLDPASMAEKMHASSVDQQAERGNARQEEGYGRLA